MEAVPRSLDHDRPRRNSPQRAHADRPARRGRALGGRQGRRLRARCCSTSAESLSSPERRRSAWRPSQRRSSSERSCPPPGSSCSARRSLGAGSRGASREAGARASRPRRCPGGGPGPPQARYGDGPVGSLGGRSPGLGRRRPDEPLRRRRIPIRRSPRSSWRGSWPRRRPTLSLDAAHREQRRHASSPGRASRRRSVRHRALRHLALRYRSRRRRAAARLALGVLRRPREDARARREHGLRSPLRRRRRRPGSGSCRSATRTASGAT